MASEEKKSKWLLYHMYDGKMVLDEAEHSAHLRQHYEGDEKFQNQIIAAVKKPLPEETLRLYEQQYEASHEPNKRPALRPYSPPPPSGRALRNR